jgi:hypothetical protein
MRRQRSQLSACTSRSADRLTVKSSPQRGQSSTSTPGVAIASRMLAASSREKGTGVVGRGSSGIGFQQRAALGFGVGRAVGPA